MRDMNTYWKSIVDSLSDRGLQFRIKWSGDNAMADWQSWVICPAEGYLETGQLGPVPVCEVEWLAVSLFDRDGKDQSKQIAKLLTEMDAIFRCTTDSIQVIFEA